MIYERHYIQFNDLVFDGFDMISDEDSELTFKGSSTEYSYGHGSYRPFKRKFLYVAERSVTLTITLNLRKLPCDQRRHYVDFAEEELAKPGKLWCIKNGKLMWAVAVVENISENLSRQKHKLIYNISFVIPGGIWNIADAKKTFLLPWNVCSFMDCKGYKDYVESCDCCESCTEKQIEEDCSCCCTDNVTEDMALCYHMDDLQEYYGCDIPYQILYDCEKAEMFKHEAFLGQRICVGDVCDDGIIAGRFYSNTEIPTDDVTIVITGQMHNPWITINDNTNIIEGDYDGALIIKPNGDVYYQKNYKDDCCEPELLEGSVWTVPSGNGYGWEIQPRSNSIIVNTNVCCNTACVYIQHQAIAL